MFMDSVFSVWRIPCVYRILEDISVGTIMLNITSLKGWGLFRLWSGVRYGNIENWFENRVTDRNSKKNLSYLVVLFLLKL